VVVHRRRSLNIPEIVGIGIAWKIGFQFVRSGLTSAATRSWDSLTTNWRSKTGSLSPREARAGRESERGVPSGLLSPTLSCLGGRRGRSSSHSVRPISGSSIRLLARSVPTGVSPNVATDPGHSRGLTVRFGTPVCGLSFLTASMIYLKRWLNASISSRS
jgi:hypothetical protein